jgi:RNA polymerase sigma-70 factor (ECF subfamily)
MSSSRFAPAAWTNHEVTPAGRPRARRRLWYRSSANDPGAQRLSEPVPPPSGDLSATAPLPGSAERDLVRRIQAGETGAEAELVERYGEVLFFLLKRWTRDPETAEDLRQETLRRAIEKIRHGEVREPEHLAAFLRSLAKNLSTQLYRRTAEKTERHESLDPAREIVGREPDALTLLLRAEKTRLARQVLGSLGTERDREVLVRYYLAEEKAEGICSDLGLTGEHFYRVLHRARQRFRRLFAERSATPR